MPRPRYLAGEYLPDQADYLTEGLLVADNVFWSPTGYRPIPSPAAIANGDLGATPLGATAYRVNGVVHLLAGTASKIRRLNASGWADIGTGYSASASVGWRFAEASGYMLCTNGADAIQRYDPAGSAGAGSIAALGGSPPLARYIAVVRDRVLLGYAASNERKIAWSDSGDITDWTPAVGGPGTYTFAAGGAITAVGGGEFGLVFQENRITRLNPAYDGSTWQYDVLTENVGCIAPWSYYQYGRLHFFLSARGWMMTDGASEPVPIGDEKIDRFYRTLEDRTYYPQMSAVVDPRRAMLFVAVPNASSPTRLLIYHIGGQKWTTGTLSGGAVKLFSGLSQSVTLEQLDATYPSIDAMTTSLDDRIFQGGYPEVFVFNSGDELQSLTGTNLAATLTDATREPLEGRLSWINKVRPLIDTATGVTVTIAGQESFGDTASSASYTTQDESGQLHVDENRNLVQVTVAVAAATTWDRYQGYVLELEDGGEA